MLKGQDQKLKDLKLKVQTMRDLKLKDQMLKDQMLKDQMLKDRMLKDQKEMRLFKTKAIAAHSKNPQSTPCQRS
jgi:hypothetical protein